MGSERIDSYDPSTPLGKLRSLGDVKSIPVTSSMFKKVNEKVNLEKKVGKKKRKKKPSVKKSKNTQKKLSDYFSPKPKPS